MGVTPPVATTVAMRDADMRTVRRARTPIVMLTTAFLLLGATGHTDPGAPTPKTVAPGAEAREVLERVRSYRDFPAYRLRGEPATTPGHGPWGSTYFNHTAAASLGDRLPMREGSLIVRENRRSPRLPPYSLSTMYKRRSGWHWIEHTYDGKVVLEGGTPLTGKLEQCIACHREALDMVFR